MKILERLLSIFDGRRRNILGAVDQPSDITSYLYKIRADTYLRLTGKSLPQPRLISKSEDTSKSIKDSISPSRRLLRKKF